MVKIFFIVLSGLCLLTACGSSGDSLEKLHGKWKIDPAGTIEVSKQYGKMSKEMKAQFAARISPLLYDFDVFSKTFKYYDNYDNANKGTNFGLVYFKVKKNSGDTIIIKDKVENITIKFKNKDKIIMSFDGKSRGGNEDIVMEKIN